MIETMKIGDERHYTRIITTKDVRLFGQVTEDMNPAHFDEAYAARTPFKKPIVHGMLVGALFSRIFGLDYPGEGTIYCGQTLKFRKPVYPDTQLDIQVRLIDLNTEKNRATFLTEVYDHAGDCVVTGEATLMPPRRSLP